MAPHIEYLIRWATTALRSRPDAEDAVQEACLNAFRCRHQFRPGTNARAWLVRIVRNTWLSSLRRQRVRPRTARLEEDLVDSETAPGRTRDPFLAASVRQEVGAAVEALDRMPGRYATALRLYAEGRTYREIADRLGIPMGTVMSRLHRARRMAARLVSERS